ncbi:hypothetical protein M8J76_008974 [Diaphorina citri]|nr:hypothetical protein M8J76_008974 [Diaphorina citri]
MKDFQTSNAQDNRRIKPDPRHSMDDIQRLLFYSYRSKDETLKAAVHNEPGEAFEKAKWSALSRGRRKKFSKDNIKIRYE